MDNEGMGNRFNAGLFFGMAVGAMAALLLAPRPGSELRAGLVEGRRKLRGTGSRTASELRQSRHDVQQALLRARRALLEAAEEVQDAARVVLTGPTPEVTRETQNTES